MGKKYSDISSLMKYKYNEELDTDGLHLNRLALVAAIVTKIDTQTILTILCEKSNYGEHQKIYNEDPRLTNIAKEEFKKIGIYLKKYRKDNNMKQVDLAKQIGITQYVLSQYENDKTTYANHKTINKIADGLGIDILDLFK